MAHVDADGALVVEFLNTFDVESDADAIGDQAAWDAWVAAHDLPPAGPVGVAHDVRRALREASSGPATGRDLAIDVSAGVVDGRPVAAPHDAPGAVLLAAVRLADAGSWSRVKLCAAETCRWAFLDESRNRSRQWCSMGVCGNRAKARSFRARARAHSD